MAIFRRRARERQSFGDPRRRGDAMPIDVDALAGPLSDEAPAGPNLEDDARYRLVQKQVDEVLQKDSESLASGSDEAARAAARELPIAVAGAQAAFDGALALLSETRDLWMTVAAAQLAMLAGRVADSAALVELAARLVESSWDALWPALDAESSDPALARRNALGDLGAFGRYVRHLERTALEPIRSAGRLTFRSLLSKLPEGTPPAQGLALAPEAVKRAIEASDLAGWEALAATFATIDQAAIRIEAAFAEKGGMAPNLDRLREEARRLRAFAAAVVDSKRPPEPEASAAGGEEGAPAGPAAAQGPIGGREQALRQLDAVRDWFARVEPSSPVPMMIDRVKRMANMNFVELVGNLSPSGFEEAKAILEWKPPEEGG